MVPDGWRATTFDELTLWTSGGTPSKNVASYWGGDIPWISALSMKTNRLSDSELRITEAGLKNGSRLADRDAVLLLVRGSELHKRIPIGIATRPVAFNQDVKALRAKEGLLPEYLLYWLLGNESLLLSKVEFTGIGAGKLDTDVMKGLPVQLPPPDEQQAITRVFSTIDGKIDLNRQMNDTLENMARALFKSWFVDFDPVRSKAQGRSSVLSAPIDGLFPDSFEDSDFGEIPKGWRVGVLDDLTEFVIGGDWGAEAATSEASELAFCIRGADIPELQRGGFGKMPKRFLKKSSLTRDDCRAMTW
ncbi:MAG: restriction endonuclease subunit S [Terriglobales bacterium]